MPVSQYTVCSIVNSTRQLDFKQSSIDKSARHALGEPGIECIDTDKLALYSGCDFLDVSACPARDVLKAKKYDDRPLTCNLRTSCEVQRSQVEVTVFTKTYATSNFRKG